VVLTSGLVASDSFNFFMAHFCVTLRGFLDSVGKLASRLNGIPACLNLEWS
jgi:hypothetical protein